jgi:phosphoglycerate kinase
MNVRDRELHLAEETVLVLADLHFGIEAELVEILESLLSRNARVIVIAGLGDPRGDINPVLSLTHMVEPLSRALKRPVTFIADCVGAIAEAGVGQVKPGSLAILENLRFHRGEVHGERGFANRLALLGDFFVDARGNNLPTLSAAARLLPTLLPSFAPADISGTTRPFSAGRP